MQGLTTYQSRAARYVAVSVLAASTLLFAQETQYPAPTGDPQAIPNSGGWKRVGDTGLQVQTAQAQPYDQSQAPPPPAGNGPYTQPTYSPKGAYTNGQQPNYNPQPAYQPGYQQPGYQPGYQQQLNYQAAAVPGNLTIPAGTFLTVRVNQLLTTDHNQPGDAFSASLVQPVVVNGVVVAEPGQTLAGRVTESQKAGRVEGTARLGVQLTELTLVDGQQLPIQSAFVSRTGSTSVGRDAGAIATTTGMGAAIGAAADWGRGAAIGAGAGAAAGIIGVLVTRGHPSVIYPEQVLTFRIDAPLSISTTQAPQAFRYVQPNEYDRPMETQPTPYSGPYASAGAYPPAPVYAAPAYPYYGYGYGYPYYGYGYGGYPYYGGFSLFLGGGRYYGGRGYYYGRPGVYRGGGYVGGGGFRGGAVRGGAGRSGGGGHR